MTATLAFPDDDPTRRYQAEGLAALESALELNGPLAPVPYFDAAPRTSRPRITEPLWGHRALRPDYLKWVLGEGPRPADVAIPAAEALRHTVLDEALYECVTAPYRDAAGWLAA